MTVNGSKLSRCGFHHVEHVMGTAVSIDVRDPTVSRSAIDEVVAWFHHVDDTFSTHKVQSPISALGRGEITLEEAGPEIRGVLERCEDMRAITDGAFDAFEVAAPNGTSLDPSGLVKGWSVQMAAEMLERHGAENFCVNAGGDIVLRGQPEVGERWRVGIRHPVLPEALALVIEAEGPLAVATSATYERGAHIVNPGTHRGADLIASATVVGPDLTVADSFATAVFVMGVDGIEWIEQQHGYDAYVIDRDHQTRWSEGFNRFRVGTAAV